MIPVGHTQLALIPRGKKAGILRWVIGTVGHCQISLVYLELSRDIPNLDYLSLNQKR